MHFPFQIPDGKAFDVVGFGTNAVDFLIRVPEYPAYNSKIELSGYIQAAGGEVASTMAGLRRLGLSASYIGRFGDDAAGEFGITSLKNEGVDLQFAESVTGARTQIAFIVIDIRTGERTVIWQRDDKLAYDASDAPIDAAGIAKVLHLTPHDAHACVRMARRAKETGTIVSLDVDNVFEGLEELLPLVDLMIASAEFPERLTGIDNHEAALKEIASRYGCGITGITLGVEGSMILSGGQIIRTDGFRVPGGCMDTTGAGDSFRVGLIYGMLKSETIENAARMANAVAALKCRAVGARTALPNPDELAAMLKE